MEFYDDAPDTQLPTPNEAEFRAYHLLAHIRDPDVGRQVERMPPDLLHLPIIRLALDIRATVQRNNAANTRRATNIEAAQNLYSRFFKFVAQTTTPFLVACLLEHHFTDIRKGALKAMKSSFLPNHRPYQLSSMTSILGFDDDLEAAAFATSCSLDIIPDSETGKSAAVAIHRKAPFNGQYQLKTKSTVLSRYIRGYEDLDQVSKTRGLEKRFTFVYPAH